MNFEPLAQYVAEHVKDPRNIEKHEWALIDHIYNACENDEWSDIKKVATALRGDIMGKLGPGENSKHAKSFQRKIGH